MKLPTTHIVTLVLALLSMCGCTHNNGDIGLWFGMCHLDSIEVNGTPDKTYDGNCYFLFQGKVFSVRWVDEENHSNFDSYATWSESNDGTTMTVTFSDSRYSPQVSYEAPRLHLCPTTIFTVVDLTPTSMTLRHTGDDDSTITTHFTRWR